MSTLALNSLYRPGRLQTQDLPASVCRVAEDLFRWVLLWSLRIYSKSGWVKLNVHACFSMLLITSPWGGHLAGGKLCCLRRQVQKSSVTFWGDVQGGAGVDTGPDGSCLLRPEVFVSVDRTQWLHSHPLSPKPPPYLWFHFLWLQLPVGNHSLKMLNGKFQK